MSDILRDLLEADARGVCPPQNWTSRAADEITRLRAALSAPPPVVPADMEPTEYALGAAQIVSRKQANGSKLWAVRDDFGNVLNSAGEWEWEPMPSGRDDAFLTRCRFASPLAARDAYMRHIAAAPQAPTQRDPADNQSQPQR